MKNKLSKTELLGLIILALIIVAILAAAFLLRPSHGDSDGSPKIEPSFGNMAPEYEEPGYLIEETPTVGAETAKAGKERDGKNKSGRKKSSASKKSGSGKSAGSSVIPVREDPFADTIPQD